MKKPLTTKRSRIIFIIFLFAFFLISGWLSLFTFRLVRVRYDTALWDIGPDGEYYEVLGEMGMNSSVGYVDCGYDALEYVDNFLDNHIVKAYPKEGYRFLRWSDGNTNAERKDGMRFEIDCTAYFVPDRSTDVPQITLKGGNFYETVRTSFDWDGSSYSCTDLGAGRVVTLQKGISYFLLDQKCETSSFGAFRKLLLFSCDGAETECDQYFALKLFEQFYGGKTMYIEVYINTEYQGLYIGYTSPVIEERGSFRQAEPLDARQSALGKWFGGGCLTFVSEEGAVTALPLAGEESFSFTAEESACVKEMSSYFSSAEMPMSPEASRRNHYADDLPGVLWPTYETCYYMHEDLTANFQYRFEEYCRELSEYEVAAGEERDARKEVLLQRAAELAAGVS